MLAQHAGIATEKAVDQLPALVVFLASGRVPNMSGSDLVIDGGMLKTV